MGMRYEIDWKRPLTFDKGAWFCGEILTHIAWPGVVEGEYGMVCNSIGKSSATYFDISAKWEYLYVEYCVDSESYDKFYIEIVGGSQLAVYGGQAPKTVQTLEYTSDGSLSTIRFRYRKDSSGTRGLDRVMIKKIIVQTADNELIQETPVFGIKDTITGEIYAYQGDTLQVVANSMDELTDCTYAATILNTQDRKEDLINNYEAVIPNPCNLIMVRQYVNPISEHYYRAVPIPKIVFEQQYRTFPLSLYPQISAITAVNLNDVIQSGDDVRYAFEIAPDVWVLNSVGEDGVYIEYTTEELTVELMRECGFRSSDDFTNVMPVLFSNRYCRMAYLLDINNFNSSTTIKSINMPFNLASETSSELEDN